MAKSVAFVHTIREKRLDNLIVSCNELALRVSLATALLLHFRLLLNEESIFLLREVPFQLLDIHLSNDGYIFVISSVRR